MGSRSENCSEYFRTIDQIDTKRIKLEKPLPPIRSASGEPFVVAGHPSAVRAMRRSSPMHAERPPARCLSPHFLAGAIVLRNEVPFDARDQRVAVGQPRGVTRRLDRSFPVHLAVDIDLRDLVAAILGHEIVA